MQSKSSCSPKLRNIKQRLQLLDKQPLVVRNIRSVELLKRVDTCSANEGIESVFLFQVTSVCGLVSAHFDLDSHGWLPLLADLDLLVVTLDAGPMLMLVAACLDQFTMGLTLFQC